MHDHNGRRSMLLRLNQDQYRTLQTRRVTSSGQTQEPCQGNFPYADPLGVGCGTSGCGIMTRWWHVRYPKEGQHFSTKGPNVRQDAPLGQASEALC
jgi:hypothetical protein